MGRLSATADRSVRRTELPTGHVVFTSFLGLDHNHSRRGPPILFETMMAGDGEWSGDVQERCCTYRQAVAQHEQIMEQTERLAELHKRFKERR